MSLYYYIRMLTEKRTRERKITDLRYNYFEREQEKHSPSVKQYHYEDRQASFSEPFSFDDSTFKRTSKNVKFQEFQVQSRDKILAKTLIEQNSILRDRLKEKEIEVKQLQQQLSICHTQLINQPVYSQKNQQNDKIIIQLRQQLWNIISKSQDMEREISQLKELLYFRRQKDRNQSDIIERQEPRRCAKSLDRKKVIRYSLDEPQECKPNAYQLDHKRSQDLIESIKGMHSKIMGFKIESLKQLWRWLKQIGQVHSSLRKWRTRSIQVLNSHFRTQRLMELISEAINLID